MGLEPHIISLLILLGGIIGIFSGLIGIGGGLLMIPALLFIYPEVSNDFLPLKEVTGIAVTQGVAGSLSSSWVHYRAGRLDLRFALMMGIGAMAGAYAGGYTSQFYPDQVIKILIVSVMASMMVLSVFSPKPADTTPQPAEQTAEASPSPLVLPAFSWGFFWFSLVVGYVSGIIGIGGAVFLVPIMYSLLQIPVRQAIGTGSGIVFLTSVTSWIGKFQAGQVLMPHAWIVTLGALVGGVVGARLSPKLPVSVLKGLFFLLTAMSLVRTLIDLFG